jgi:hypothetical protein
MRMAVGGAGETGEWFWRVVVVRVLEGGRGRGLGRRCGGMACSTRRDEKGSGVEVIVPGWEKHGVR